MPIFALGKTPEKSLASLGVLTILVRGFPQAKRYSHRIILLKKAVK
jgi:hypothetical protein